MSQQILGQEPIHQETRPDMEQDWWDLLNPAEQRIMDLIWDYQQVSQQWIDYESDGQFNGVRHGALLSWARAEKLMTKEEVEQSLSRMVSDPRIPFYETSMSKPDDRRYEHRW